MFRTARTLGQLGDELPTIREELQQVADEARSTFSRVEDAAGAAVFTMVIIAAVAVTALIFCTVAVVSTRNSNSPGGS